MTLSSAAQPTSSSILIFFALLIFIIAVRIYRNFRGVRVSGARTIGYTIFYFLFGGFFVSASFFDGVPMIYVVPDAVFLILAAVWSYRYSDRRILFWRSSSDSSIYYIGGVIIYLIYLGGLVARLAVEYMVIGPSAFTFSLSSAINPSAIAGFAVTDAILTFGIGLLIGRNIRVYKRYRMIMDGKETVSIRN